MLITSRESESDMVESKVPSLLVCVSAVLMAKDMRFKRAAAILWLRVYTAIHFRVVYYGEIKASRTLGPKTNVPKQTSI